MIKNPKVRFFSVKNIFFTVQSNNLSEAEVE